MIRRATQITRPLALFTPLGPDKLLLRRLDGREQISELFQYDLELLSDDEAIDPARILGRNPICKRFSSVTGTSRESFEDLARAGSGSISSCG